MKGRGESRPCTFLQQVAKVGLAMGCGKSMLLLNWSLTVTEGQARGTASLGWEKLSDAAIGARAGHEQRTPVVAAACLCSAVTRLRPDSWQRRFADRPASH